MFLNNKYKIINRKLSIKSVRVCMCGYICTWAVVSFAFGFDGMHWLTRTYIDFMHRKSFNVKTILYFKCLWSNFHSRAEFAMCRAVIGTWFCWSDARIKVLQQEKQQQGPGRSLSIRQRLQSSQWKFYWKHFMGFIGSTTRLQRRGSATKQRRIGTHICFTFSCTFTIGPSHDPDSDPDPHPDSDSDSVSDSDWN